MSSFLRTRKIFFPILLMLMYFAACTTDSSKKEEATAEQKPLPGYNPYEKSELTVEVFKIDSIEVNGNRGWGYDILVDGKMYIHQPNVPAVMGNNGFSSEEKALKTGEYIISKLRNNIIPPSVTPEELDSLNVLN